MNPIIEHLKHQAQSAPFKLEKENYQMALAEIERLQSLVPVHSDLVMPKQLVQDVCRFLSTCTLESVQAQELLQQLHMCLSQAAQS